MILNIIMIIDHLQFQRAFDTRNLYRLLELIKWSLNQFEKGLHSSAMCLCIF